MTETEQRLLALEAKFQFLMEVHHGLSGVVKALAGALIEGGQLDTEAYGVLLRGLPEVLGLSDDQRSVFLAHLQAIGERTWVPTVIDGGQRSGDEEPAVPE